MWEAFDGKVLIYVHKEKELNGRGSVAFPPPITR